MRVFIYNASNSYRQCAPYSLPRGFLWESLNEVRPNYLASEIVFQSYVLHGNFASRKKKHATAQGPVTWPHPVYYKDNSTASSREKAHLRPFD